MCSLPFLCESNDQWHDRREIMNIEEGKEGKEEKKTTDNENSCLPLSRDPPGGESGL